MQENHFDKLLRAFRAAHADYGDGNFSLFALTWEERKKRDGDIHAKRHKHVQAKEGYLGFVPLDGDSSSANPRGFCIFGWLDCNRWDHETRGLEEPFYRFKSLAKETGALLPLAVRKQIQYPPDDSVSL